MTDKEKLEAIRAEIKRRKKLHEKSLINPIHEGFGLQNVIKAKISELTYLHSFIESMQEEPVSEDLEEAIGEYCSNPDNFISYVDTGFAYRSEQKDDIPLIIKAIRFGANWQKQQMMKEADDYIVDDDNTIKRFYDTGGVVGKPIIFGYTPDSINVGDHVKVIVIKED